MRAHIKSDVVFQNTLNRGDSFIWGYKMSVANAEGVKEQMQRTRKYTGNAVSLDFNDTVVEALVFKDKYVIHRTKSEKSIESSIQDQLSYYAKDIGMIYYKRTVGENTFEFELKDIYSVENLNTPDRIKERYK
jgi:hypothetical protein